MIILFVLTPEQGVSVEEQTQADRKKALFDHFLQHFGYERKPNGNFPDGMHKLITNFFTTETVDYEMLERALAPDQPKKKSIASIICLTSMLNDESAGIIMRNCAGSQNIELLNVRSSAITFLNEMGCIVWRNHIDWLFDIVFTDSIHRRSSEFGWFGIAFRSDKNFAMRKFGQLLAQKDSRSTNFFHWCERHCSEEYIATLSEFIIEYAQEGDFVRTFAKRAFAQNAEMSSIVAQCKRWRENKNTFVILNTLQFRADAQLQEFVEIFWNDFINNKPFEREGFRADEFVAIALGNQLPYTEDWNIACHEMSLSELPLRIKLHWWWSAYESCLHKWQIHWASAEGVKRSQIGLELTRLLSDWVCTLEKNEADELLRDTNEKNAADILSNCLHVLGKDYIAGGIGCLQKLIDARNEVCAPIRRESVRSLEYFCGEAKVQLLLATLLDDEDKWIRRAAVKILSKANMSEPSVIYAIEKALNDEFKPVRVFAEDAKLRYNAMAFEKFLNTYFKKPTAEERLMRAIFSKK